MKANLSRMKNFILNSVKDKRFIWLLIGWMSAFVIAGIAYIFFHKRLFINHFDAWLQTIGTLFGSFAGALLAGKYAIRAGNRQIEANINEKKKEKLNQLVKFNENYLLEIRSIRGICNRAFKIMTDKPLKYEKNQKLQGYSMILQRDTEKLKHSYDWSIVPALKYNDYLVPLYLCTELGSSIPIYLENNDFDKKNIEKRWTDHIERLDPSIKKLEDYSFYVKKELTEMN
ncbi:hypothetical protein [Sporolactobacillus pectinivorans]|uniref:hypothetical protein n=1 Tax=Sporolactobacillus pectinivorans TaxID=1591408 RepID=UPI000C268730|nr:hypothetical protein [Sporolactobacillus pectinivorans]